MSAANSAGGAVPPAGSSQPGTTGARPKHQPYITHRRPGSTMALVRRWRDLKAIWFDHRLEPTFREELMVAVAAANSCRQCSFAHREWALAEGLPKEELAALEGLDADFFDAHKWAAIAWVQAITHSDFTAPPEEIDANFRREYTPQEQADIQLVARTMYWMNEISNGVSIVVARFRGEPVPDGTRSIRLLEATVLFIIVAPGILIWLAFKQRRRPSSLFRDIPEFFRVFEARQAEGPANA